VEGGVAAYLWLAVVFGVVNAIVGPVLRVVAFPVTVLTLGLFALVVNGVLIAIVAGLSEHLQVGSFGWTVLAAVVVSVVSAVVQAVARGPSPGHAEPLQPATSLRIRATSRARSAVSGRPSSSTT
jgi:putative membrane protein